MLFLPVTNKSWNTRNGVLDDVGMGVWVEWVVHPQIIFVKNGFFKQILFCMGTLKFDGTTMWSQLSSFIV